MWLGKDGTQEWEEETCKCFKGCKGEKKGNFFVGRKGMQLRLKKLDFLLLNYVGENEKNSRENVNNEVLKWSSTGQIPQPCKLILKDL